MAETKPGYKTTENVWTGLIALISGYGIADDEPLVRALSFLGLAFVVGCYHLSRGLAKGRNGA